MRSHPYPLLQTGWLSVRSHLMRALKEFQPDLIYAHHTQVNGFLAWRLHQTTRIPYVITDHDFGEIETCRSYPARKSFFAPIVAESSSMVSVASRMERLMADIFPEAITRTVHNGSDPPPATFYSKSRPDEIASRLVVFSACAFYERKGIPLLVRAFGRIASKFPNAVLRIAGDGELRAQVETAIRDAGVSTQVQLLGQISHAEVLQEMIWADAFALPGWNEPFATAFTEALSAGCPIIYASDGGITDVVSDGVQGLAVEPRSEESLTFALEAMLSDESRRRAMASEAKCLFESRLLWDHNAACMKSVFMSALQ